MSTGARAVLLVSVFLGGAALAAVLFVVAYLATDSNALLGATLGACFGLLACALVVASRRLVPQIEAVEERTPQPAPEPVIEAAAAAISVDEPRLPRRRLLLAAGGAAATALAAALAIPLASLGSGVDDRLDGSPWRRGRRLVDSEGRALRAADIALGAFLTAFPEGADPRELGSPIVVVRIPPDELRLPPSRHGWAPDGIVAFSKICTHAGCAIALFRYPLSEPTSARPALVCPCHYSTFDVAQAARPIFGPAARALPQLPLAIAADGTLVAAGPLSGQRRPVLVGSARVMGFLRAVEVRVPRRLAPRARDRCATSSPTTGRSCSARSRSTASSCSS